MISCTLTNTAMIFSKLQDTLANVQSELKMEKVFLLAKDTRIKALEDLVIKVGDDPTNINATEELVRKKNIEIASLEKQLNLPTTKDPLAKDIE